MELVNFEEYSQDFVWDMKLHFPIPTANYILNRGNWNVEDGRNINKTHAEILVVVREAKNYLFSKTGLRGIYQKRVERLIAHNIDYIYDVLEYIMTFVQIVNTSGDLLKFYQLLTESKFKIPALDMAIGNLSFMKQITLPIYVEYNGF